MKRPVIWILTLVAIILFLDKCTSMNVFSVFKSAEHNRLPHLKDGTRSKSFELRRLKPDNYNNINYDPAGNYFLVEGNFDVRKIDAQGTEVFTLPRSEMYVPRFTSYVFDSTGVYDFSLTHIVKKLFSKKLNLDQQLSKAAWQNLFDDLYARADVVLFGYTDLYKKGDPVFFRVQREWILLITTDSETRLDNLAYKGGIKFKGYPAKYHHLYLLKDTNIQAYSNVEGTSDHFLQSYTGTDFKEEQMVYPSNRKIKTLYYEKTGVYAEIAYTIIPLTWLCTTGQSIIIDNEELKFRCGGTKHIGLFNKVDTYLRWFSVPQQYMNKTQVSFLEYSFPSNAPSESNGLYIIRKIK